MRACSRRAAASSSPVRRSGRWRASRSRPAATAGSGRWRRRSSSGSPTRDLGFARHLRRRPRVATDLPPHRRPRRAARARRRPRLDRGWIVRGARDRFGRLLSDLSSMKDDGPPPVRPRGAIGGEMAYVLLGIAHRLQLPVLVEHYSQRWILGLFALVNGLISIALMTAVALATGAPFIFPSLGPTAFLLFYTPTQPAASPRNTIGGHLIGVLAGYLALVLFGLTDRGPALAVGVDWSNVAAAALSLGLTSGAMVWFGVPHPPAGATTLIVSLGILREPWQLAVLMLAVGMLVVQGIAINRLAGIDYPLWAPRPSPAAPPGGGSA